MARKIDPNAQPAPPPAADDGADDLSILHPDRELTLGGRTVTVREYRFIAGLRVRARAKPFTDALRAQIETGQTLVEDIIDIVARHETLVRELIVEATDGADADWLEGLNDADGDTLLVTWWAVNGPFFMRQIMRRLAERAVFQAQTNQPDGATPSPASSAPATGDPMTSSPPTPSVN